MLVRAVESCLSQVGVDLLELIVVDNQSSPENMLDESQIADGHLKTRLQLHRQEQNLGVAGGRSYAAHAAKGDYLFFLDDDAILTNEYALRDLVHVMDSNPDLAVIAPEVFEPQSKRYIRGPLDRSGKWALTFVGGAHMIRRAAVKPYGSLYPEALHFGSEELFLSMLLWNDGWRIQYRPSVRVEHWPPDAGNYTGSARDLQILASSFTVRRLVLPRALLPVSIIMLGIRLLRNGLLTRSGVSSWLQLYRERYDPADRRPVKFATYVHLLIRFRSLELV